jgi:hypothetical protein
MPDLTAPEAIIMAGKVDQTWYIPVSGLVIFQTGTHGNFWNTLISRYARHETSSGTTPYYRTNEQLDPRSLIDPRYGTTPIVLTARECLACTYPGGILVDNTTRGAKAFWGYGGNAGGMAGVTADTMYFPFVGFQMYFESHAGAVNANTFWRCLVVDENLGVLYRLITTADAKAPHEFQLVFDGRVNTVFFYIDGVLWGQYAPGTNTAPGQLAPYPAPAAGVGAMAWNMIYASQALGSGNAAGLLQQQFAYHMSPATPLVTITASDV